MKLSRSSLYLILICVFLLTVNITLGLVLTRQSDAALRTLIENRMLDISNTAAAMLNGDELAAMRAEDADTPAYQSVLRTLSYFQDNIDLEYIYCIRDMGERNFVFTIDPADDPGEFGESVAFTPALYQASLGTAAVDREAYGDRWGRFYSAYSPVFDSRGSVAGIVAVDFSAAWYEQQIARQVRSTVWITGISLFFAGLIIVLIAGRFRRQFRSMLQEMNTVSAGIETLVREISPGAEADAPRDPDGKASRDEIAELGHRIRLLEDQLSGQIAFVRSQAFVDGLTGLGNRAAYEEHVKRLDAADSDLSARALRVDQALDDSEHASVSMGFAAYDPATDMGYRVVFNRADLAMYNAKKAYYLAHSRRQKQDNPDRGDHGGDGQ